MLHLHGISKWSEWSARPRVSCQNSVQVSTKSGEHKKWNAPDTKAGGGALRAYDLEPRMRGVPPGYSAACASYVSPLRGHARGECFSLGACSRVPSTAVRLASELRRPDCPRPQWIEGRPPIKDALSLHLSTTVPSAGNLCQAADHSCLELPMCMARCHSPFEFWSKRRGHYPKGDRLAVTEDFLHDRACSAENAEYR